MKHTIANWPNHPKNLVATFSHNEITTLETMPGSDAEDIKLVFSYCEIKYLETGLFQSCINIKFLDISHNLLESKLIILQDLFFLILLLVLSFIMNE